MFIILLFSASISASFAADYGPALDKAKDAALIQTGIQGNIDKLKSYGEGQAKRYAYNLGVEKELATLIVGYKIYHDKGVSFPVDHTKRLSIHTDRVELKINF